MKIKTVFAFTRLKMYILLGITVPILISCGKQRPEKSCFNFAEMPDPTSDTLSDWSNVPAGLQASFISIDDKLPKSVAPPCATHQECNGYRLERRKSVVSTAFMVGKKCQSDRIRIHRL